MTKVIADITMSLDGFVTGPNAGPTAGLGEGGMPLHDWVFEGHGVDEAVLAKATQRSGAVVMGRNLFDVVDGPDGWNDEIGYGAHHVGRPPFFAVGCLVAAGVALFGALVAAALLPAHPTDPDTTALDEPDADHDDLAVVAPVA